MATGSILVVDDNKNILKALKILLQFEFEYVHTINSPKEIPNLLEKDEYDLIILDMNFETSVNTGNEGMFWLDRILSIDPNISVVLITAFGDVELAVNSIKRGATDFILKPWDNQKLIATIKSAIKLCKTKKQLVKLEQRNLVLNEEITIPHRTIVGHSEALMKVMRVVKKVAKTDANVLITGENGTGKELIAKEIHSLSQRSEEILVSLDIGSLPETLFEDELFGHTKGAFTDAFQDRVGKIESADGGTLFLDEIGNLPLSLQAKLLTVLESREVIRIGSNKSKKVDIRLICASNKNIPLMVENQEFREDLLYRINTIVVEVPPLRERAEDILLLANFYLDKYNKKYRKKNLILSQKSQEELLKYKWPGNVRELQHCIEKAVILCENISIEPEDLFLKPTDHLNFEVPKTIEEMEQIMVRKAIERNNGNMSAAAEELGITRQTLYIKFRKGNPKTKLDG